MSETDPINDELDRFFNLSLDMVCIAGFDGYFKRLNPAWERALGYTRAELLEKPFVAFIHPDDVAATEVVTAGIAEGATFLSFENRYRTRGGEWRWLQWTAAPYVESQLIYAVARDVTEQRRIAEELRDREAWLRAVFDSAPDGLLVLDDAGVIRSLNPAAESTFGRASGEVVGRSIHVLIPEGLRGSGAIGAVGSANRAREVTGERKDGTRFPVELSITEVVQGAARGHLGITRDISDRKKTEGMRTALLAREAHQLGRIEMASGMLHDLGNALTGIGARAVDVQGTMLRASSLTEKLSRTADFLRANLAPLGEALGGAKAKALVDLASAMADSHAGIRSAAIDSLARLLAFVSHAQELLTTHRSYSGAGGGATRETMSVERILFDAQMLMSDAVVKRGGAMVIRCDDDIPRVTTERSKLMQVLVNLLKNAAEAFDAAELGRSPEITLTAAVGEAGGVVIEIRDNGPGFEPAMAERLFEGGYSTKQRGSGLGLGAARRVAESLGGTLAIRSDGPGLGAVARFDLPKDMTANG